MTIWVLSKLAPLPMIAQADAITAQLAELIVQAVARSPANVLAEIYMAGFWHGAEVARTRTASSGEDV